MEVKTESPLCADIHTPCPKHFSKWLEWAEGMRRTHEQKMCPYCGLWKVWTLKSDKKEGK